MTISCPTILQKKTHAIPSAPLSLNSNRPPPKASVCGKPKFGPYSTIDQTSQYNELEVLQVHL